MFIITHTNYNHAPQETLLTINISQSDDCIQVCTQQLSNLLHLLHIIYGVYSHVVTSNVVQSATCV